MAPISSSFHYELPLETRCLLLHGEVHPQCMYDCLWYHKTRLLKSDCRWAKTKLTLQEMNVKTGFDCQKLCTYIIPQREAETGRNKKIKCPDGHEYFIHAKQEASNSSLSFFSRLAFNKGSTSLIFGVFISLRVWVCRKHWKNITSENYTCKKSWSSKSSSLWC